MNCTLSEIAVKKFRSQFENCQNSHAKKQQQLSTKQRAGLPFTYDLARELLKLGLPKSVIAQICFEEESPANFEKGVRFIAAQQKLQAFKAKSKK